MCNVTLYFDISKRMRYTVPEVIFMPEKKNSDAKIRANNKYSAAHYDRINMALPKGSRALIEHCAKLHGETLNRYVCRVVLEQVRKDMQQEKTSQREFFDLF